MPDEECPIAAAAANITNADLKPAPFVPDLPPLVREIEEFEGRDNGSNASGGGNGAGVGVGCASSVSATVSSSGGANGSSASANGGAGKRPHSHYVHNLYAYPLSVDFGSFSKTRNVAVRVQLRLDDEGVGNSLSRFGGRMERRE